MRLSCDVQCSLPLHAVSMRRFDVSDGVTPDKAAASALTRSWPESGRTALGHDLLFCFPPELEVGLPALRSRKPTGRIEREAAADVRNSIGSPLAAARPTARR
jgi:hypothetical protein